MSDKIALQIVENIMRLNLMQRQNIYERISSIEADPSLAPEEKLQLLAELLNPIQKEKP